MLQTSASRGHSWTTHELAELVPEAPNPSDVRQSNGTSHTNGHSIPSRGRDSSISGGGGGGGSQHGFSVPISSAARSWSSSSSAASGSASAFDIVSSPVHKSGNGWATAATSSGSPWSTKGHAHTSSTTLPSTGFGTSPAPLVQPSPLDLYGTSASSSAAGDYTHQGSPFSASGSESGALPHFRRPSLVAESDPFHIPLSRSSSRDTHGSLHESLSRSWATGSGIITSAAATTSNAAGAASSPIGQERRHEPLSRHASFSASTSSVSAFGLGSIWSGPGPAATAEAPSSSSQERNGREAHRPVPSSIALGRSASASRAQPTQDLFSPWSDSPSTPLSLLSGPDFFQPASAGAHAAAADSFDPSGSSPASSDPWHHPTGRDPIGRSESARPPFDKRSFSVNTAGAANFQPRHSLDDDAGSAFSSSPVTDMESSYAAVASGGAPSASPRHTSRGGGANLATMHEEHGNDADGKSGTRTPRHRDAAGGMTSLTSPPASAGARSGGGGGANKGRTYWERPEARPRASFDQAGRWSQLRPQRDDDDEGGGNGGGSESRRGGDRTAIQSPVQRARVESQSYRGDGHQHQQHTNGGTESRRHSIATGAGSAAATQSRRAVGFDVSSSGNGAGMQPRGSRSGSVGQVSASGNSGAPTPRPGGGYGLFSGGGMTLTDDDLIADLQTLQLNLDQVAEKQQQEDARQQQQQQQQQQHRRDDPPSAARTRLPSSATVGSHPSSMPADYGERSRPLSSSDGGRPSDARDRERTSLDSHHHVSQEQPEADHRRDDQAPRDEDQHQRQSPRIQQQQQQQDQHTSQQGARRSSHDSRQQQQQQPQQPPQLTQQQQPYQQSPIQRHQPPLGGPLPHQQLSHLAYAAGAAPHLQHLSSHSPSPSMRGAYDLGLARHAGAGLVGLPIQTDLTGLGYPYGMLSPQQQHQQLQQQHQQQHQQLPPHRRAPSFPAAMGGQLMYTPSLHGPLVPQGFLPPQQTGPGVGMMPRFDSLSDYTMSGLATLGPMAPPSGGPGDGGPSSLQELGKGVPLASLPRGTPLYIVEFKQGRTDIYFKQTNPQGSGAGGGATDDFLVQRGDLVIVEADRGKDLGTVVNDSITVDQVQSFLAHQNELAKTSEGAGLRVQRSINPKRLYSRATQADTNLLHTKAQDEERALQLCITKVTQRGLPMQVVAAEMQWDRRKLTFYYTSSARVDFRDLVKELFRLYKTRIWLCQLGHPSGLG